MFYLAESLIINQLGTDVEWSLSNYNGVAYSTDGAATQFDYLINSDLPRFVCIYSFDYRSLSSNIVMQLLTPSTRANGKQSFIADFWMFLGETWA